MYKGAVGTRQATRMEVEKVSKVKPNAQPELEKKQLAEDKKTKNKFISQESKH